MLLGLSPLPAAPMRLAWVHFSKLRLSCFLPSCYNNYPKDYDKYRLLGLQLEQTWHRDEVPNFLLGGDQGG